MNIFLSLSRIYISDINLYEAQQKDFGGDETLRGE